jgi:hypothetical protein
MAKMPSAMTVIANPAMPQTAKQRACVLGFAGCQEGCV